MHLTDMLMGTPAEDNLVGFDIDLVYQTVLDPAILGAANGSQVSTGHIHGRYKDGTIVRDLALMDINARVEGHWIKNRSEILRLTVQGDTVDFMVGSI